MTGPFVLIIATAAALAIGPRLEACGDKSLSPGGIRMMRAQAARYPASVLAYAPSGSPTAQATREMQLPQLLRRVGHRFQEVATIGELRTSIESGKYNIVVTDLADVSNLERDLGSISTRVVFVPIAYKLTKAETREAARQRRFLINARGLASEKMQTIADAVAFVGPVPRKG